MFKTSIAMLAVALSISAIKVSTVEAGWKKKNVTEGIDSVSTDRVIQPELRMIEIQSLNSKRATAVQMITENLKNNNCGGCEKNIGH
jgi:hypothetical protein